MLLARGHTFSIRAAVCAGRSAARLHRTRQPLRTRGASSAPTFVWFPPLRPRRRHRRRPPLDRLSSAWGWRGSPMPHCSALAKRFPAALRRCGATPRALGHPQGAQSGAAAIRPDPRLACPGRSTSPDREKTPCRCGSGAGSRDRPRGWRPCRSTIGREDPRYRLRDREWRGAAGSQRQAWWSPTHMWSRGRRSRPFSLAGGDAPFAAYCNRRVRPPQ